MTFINPTTTKRKNSVPNTESTKRIKTGDDGKKYKADSFSKIVRKLSVINKDQSQVLLNMSINILKAGSNDIPDKQRELRSKIESYGIIIDDKNDLIPLFGHESGFSFFGSSFELAQQDQQFIFWLWIQATEAKHDFIFFNDFIHDNELFLEEKSNLFCESYFQELISNSQDLFNAIEKKETNSVIKILNENPEFLNFKSRFGQTPLHLAIVNNLFEVVHFLIQQPGTNVNAEDNTYKRSPLDTAIANDHLEILQLLLSRIDINRKNRYGNTLLHWAAEKGHFEIIKQLLSRTDIDINIKNQYDYTPLHWAITHGQTEAVRLLLQHPQIDVNIKDCLFKETSLETAVKKGHLEIIKFLISQPKIDINQKNRNGFTLLHLAIDSGHTKVAQLLLEHPEIDVNTEDCLFKNSPLDTAVEKDLLEIIKLLISQPKIDINRKNRDGRTLLHLAAEKGHLEIIELLLSRPDIDVNKIDNMDKTPLHLATSKGCTGIIKLLILSGKLHLDENTLKSLFHTSDSDVNLENQINFVENYHTKYKNILKDPFNNKSKNEIAEFINELRKRHRMAELPVDEIPIIFETTTLEGMLLKKIRDQKSGIDYSNAPPFLKEIIQKKYKKDIKK